MVANLIENAIKYASASISVTVVADGPPRIEVADDGPGIAAQDLPHVFERLYVAGHEPQRKEVGSGLGLAIARELTEAMGGTVRAEANPSGGTRLVIALRPAAPAPTAPPVAGGHPPRRRARRRHPASPAAVRPEGVTQVAQAGGAPTSGRAGSRPPAPPRRATAAGAGTSTRRATKARAMGAPESR